MLRFCPRIALDLSCATKRVLIGWSAADWRKNAYQSWDQRVRTHRPQHRADGDRQQGDRVRCGERYYGFEDPGPPAEIRLDSGEPAAPHHAPRRFHLDRRKG